MRDIILIIDVLAALGIIGLVLLQQGKGADMGSGFGSGASQTLFGARGSANFLTRATAILATVFFLANVGLAWLASKEAGPQIPAGIEQTAPPVDTVPVPEQPPAPVVPK